MCRDFNLKIFQLELLGIFTLEVTTFMFVLPSVLDSSRRGIDPSALHAFEERTELSKGEAPSCATPPPFSSFIYFLTIWSELKVPAVRFAFFGAEVSSPMDDPEFTSPSLNLHGRASGSDPAFS